MNPTKSMKIIETTKSTLQKQVESNFGTQFTGSIGERHKIKDYKSGRPDLAPLSFATQCQPTAFRKR